MMGASDVVYVEKRIHVLIYLSGIICLTFKLLLMVLQP